MDTQVNYSVWSSSFLFSSHLSWKMGVMWKWLHTAPGHTTASGHVLLLMFPYMSVTIMSHLKHVKTLFLFYVCKAGLPTRWSRPLPRGPHTLLCSNSFVVIWLRQICLVIMYVHSNRVKINFINTYVIWFCICEFYLLFNHFVWYLWILSWEFPVSWDN